MNLRIVPLVPNISLSSVVCRTIIQPKGAIDLCNHVIFKENLGNWDLTVPTVQIIYKNSANRSINMSHFEVIHGYEPMKTLDLIHISLHASVSMSAKAFIHHLHDLHIEINKRLEANNASYKLRDHLLKRHFEFNIEDYVILQARSASPSKI